MSFAHSIYGLRLSANLAIPGLPVLSRLSNCDLLVHLKSPGFDWSGEGGTTIYSSSSRRSEDSSLLSVLKLKNRDYVAFFYGDGARFAIRCDGSEIWADWPDGYSTEDAATYLVGPVMGFVLRLKGITPLHASAVGIDGTAVAMVGPPGAGKSTTAAALAQLGCDILSDDVAALREKDGQLFVAPGYPRVNLWPDSVRALHGSEDALPRITPTWAKRYLPLEHRGRFESKHLPLGAIYLLAERDASRKEVLIEKVPAPEALISLVANTYVNYVLDREMRHREFHALSRLVSTTPVRRIFPSGDPSNILAMCEAVADDARKTIGSLAGMSSGAD